VNVNLAGQQYFYIRVKAFSGATNYSLLALNDYAGSTLATARDIGVSQGQTSDQFSAYGKIFFGDYLDFRDNVDVVKFRMEAPGTVSLRQLRPGGTGGLVTTMQLLDSNGNVLANGFGPGDGSLNLDRFSLNTGTYYVKFTQVSGSGDYSYRIVSDYAGDTVATARNLGDLTDTSRQMFDMTGSAFLTSYSDEADLYKFTLSKTSPVDIGLNVLTTPVPTFDSNLELARDFDGNGFITSNEVINASNLSGNDKISTTLAAGTYFVRVKQNGAYTSYELNLDSDFDAVNGDPKAFSNLVLARDTGAATSQKNFVGGFGISAGDISDFYKFTMPAAGSFKAQVALQTGVNSRQLATPFLQVVRDANNNGRFDAGEEVTPATNSSLNTTLAAGTYFLKVGSSTGGQTAYNLTLQPGVNGVAVADPDDTIAEVAARTANIKTVGQSADFTLDNPQDVDLVKVTVVKGQKIGFNVDGRNGSNLDTYLRIFNSSGTQLAANDNAAAPGEAAGKFSYLSYTFNTAGTYYVGVSLAPNKSYSAVTGSGDVNGVAPTGAYRITLLNQGVAATAARTAAPSLTASSTLQLAGLFATRTVL
jgi:hypothetical protein